MQLSESIKSQINLVVLTPGFAVDEKDTTNIPSLQLYLQNLKSSFPQINIQIITFHYPTKRGWYIWNGINVFAIGGHKTKIGMISIWIRVLIQLLSLKRKFGIDVVHAFWLIDTTLIGLLFRLFTRTPLVVTAMGQDVKKGNGYLKMLRIFKTDLIFLSQFHAGYNPKLSLHRDFRIIPFGVDPVFYDLPLLDRSTDILGVGSLNKVKNYRDFIEIIRYVAQVLPELRCRIIGEGTERLYIEQLISKYKLERTITLVGEIAFEKVAQEMKSCKVLLHTSLFESQGLIFTEALACGAYVVSYHVGITKELISKRIFTGESKNQLSSQLVDILQKKEPDYSPEILYTINKSCTQYNNIYTNLALRK
jgi:glycosyltransferase involved in cell wall biosynthesis